MSDTLCWSCQRATNKPGMGCSWSRKENPKPVDGWDATPTVLKHSGYKYSTESFIVHTCPEFLPDKKGISHGRICTYYTYRGKTMSIWKWSKVAGISHSTLRARIRKGMPFEEAIKREVKGRAKNG